MRLWRNRRITLVLLLVTWLAILVTFWRIFHLSEKEEENGDNPPELLWWSSNIAWNYDQLRICGIHRCRVTNNRQHLPHARAVLFYGSNMKTHDFPLPRLVDQVWALLHEESPRNIPFVPFNEFLKHFNYTSTFSRFSDLPLTTQYLPSASELISMDYFIDFHTKSIYNSDVIFLQSDCDTMSGREDYVKELMRYIKVDSFGKCLHNMEMPPSMQEDYLNHMYSPELLQYISRYKFMIAIENGVCHDYITEKFWRPLIAGVIPIYFGSPTIKEWQPQKRSAIYVNDFPNAGALARYLYQLIDNQTEYDSYRQHKLHRTRKIENNRLIEQLMIRLYHVDEMQTGSSSLFQKFECVICKSLFGRDKFKEADVLHYECPLPPVYAPLENKMEPQNVADWRGAMEVGRCQAKLLDNYFQKNRNYTQKQYERKLSQWLKLNFC